MNRSKQKIQIHHWTYCGYVVIFSLALQASMIQSAVAQSDDEKKAVKPKPEMLECKVRVTDPDGNPIEDATVYCSGLRTQLESTRNWSWNPDRFGPAPRVKTDGDGIAIMPYPRYVSGNMETNSTTWSVNHPDFVFLQKERYVKDEPAEIQLQRGFRVALTAKNSTTGEAIKEDLYAVIGLSGEAKWKLKKNGTLVSGVYPKRKCYLRVMQCTEGQPTLFSEMITVEPGEQSRVLLRDIELSPGTRLEGKLDASVKRPVKNGYVTGCVRITMEPKDWETYWAWSDKAKIKEDGSFVFESLPRDAVWQMIPICDDWVPALPKFESVAEHFPTEAASFRRRGNWLRQPQLIRLSGDEVSVTLEMIPAASVKAIFVDTDGKPVEGVEASTNPTQAWFPSGANILGSAYQSRDLLIVERRGEEFEWPRINPFSGVSDANGVCEFKNLPPMTRGGLFARHDKFELPIELPTVNGRRKVKFTLKEGEQKELTIKLQAKGEGPKLGEEATDD